MSSLTYNSKSFKLKIMANIARGQITIVDLNDGKSVNLFISSSKPATQIYDKDTKAYTPNYTVSPFNVLTP